MLYEEITPASGLRSHVLAYWRFSLDDGDPESFPHAIVPDGLVSFAATALEGGARVSLTVVGPSTRAHVTQARRGVRTAGLRLQPAAASALLGRPPADLRDRMAPLDAVCPQHAGWVGAALETAFAPDGPAAMDARLAAPISAAPPPDPLVAAAAARLIEGIEAPTIRELAAEAGLSERQFNRRFLAAAGLGPKAFARARRQRAAWLASLSGEASSLAQVSAQAGFSDQAHFIREVQAAFGARPSAVAAYLARIRHRMPELD